MATESFIGLSSMENDIQMLSSEKQIIENERENFEMSVADMEKEREDLSNELKDTIEKCTILSSELEKAMLSENEVQTLLAENQKLKDDNLMLLEEQGNLKAQLQNLDLECSKLKGTIIDTQAENEYLVREKHIVESKVQQLEMDIHGLNLEKDNIVDDLKNKLRVAAQEKEILASEHSMCLDELKEKDQQISNFQDTIKHLETTKIDLHNEVTLHKEEKIIALTQLQQMEASLKNLENQLKQQVEKKLNMQKTNEDLVVENSKLYNEIAEMKEEKSEILASITDFEGKLQEKAQQVSNFRDTIKELEAAKMDLHNEVMVHQEEKRIALAQLHQVEATMKNLEMQFEQQVEKNSNLTKSIDSMEKHMVEVRRSLNAKIEELHEEKDAALLQLQASQASVRNFETTVEKQNENIASLQQANEELNKTICTLTEESEQVKFNLQEEVKSMTNNINNMERKLVEVKRSLHVKMATLQKEKDVALLELHTSQISIRNFENMLEKQNENITSLQQINDELKKTICTITEESEHAKAKLQEEAKSMANNMNIRDKQLVEVRRSLHAKIASLQEEKDAALLELRESQSSCRNLEDVVIKKNENTRSLQQANDELKKTIHTLIEESEQVKAKLQEEVEAMTYNIDNMEKQLVEVRRSLHAKITILHEEKDIALQELQASQASVRNFKSMVEKQNKKITALQEANDELKNTICTLTEESEQAKVKLQEEIELMTNNIDTIEKQLVEVRRSLNAKIEVLHEEKESALQQLQTSQAYVRNIESTIEKQNENIASLQQANEELNKTIYTLTEESQQAKAKLWKEVQSMANNIDNMERKLVEVRRSLHAKIVALQKEKDDALLELHTSQITIRNFESMVEKQNENITSLQQANDKLKKTISTTAEESEQAKAQLQEEVKSMTNNINSLDKQLVEVRRSLHAKIAALQVEKDAALLELQESQSSVKNLEGVVDKKNENISSLQQAKDELNKTIHTLMEESEQSKAKLQEEIEAMTNNIGNMEKQLVEVRRSLHAKITSLHDEKDTTLLELQASQASVKSFESTVEKQNEEITSLQEANDELKKTICTLTEESEQAKAKSQEEAKSMANNIDSLKKQLVEVRRSLHAKIVALHQEKNAALQELQGSQVSLRNFENVVEEQNGNIITLQRANDELKKTICTLTEESEQAKVKLLEEIEVMTNNIDSMEKQLVEVRRGLKAKIKALHEEKESALLQLHASQASVRNFESSVEKKNESIASLIQANEELNKTICTLTEESEQAKTKLQEEVKSMANNIDNMEKKLVEVRRSLHAKIAALQKEKDDALLELHTSQITIRNFESMVEKKNENITSLQHANDELKKTIYTMAEESEQAKALLQEEVKSTKNKINSQDKQLIEVRRSLHAKIAALQVEKDAALLGLQESQSSVKNLERVVNKKNENITSLQRVNDELNKTIRTLMEESEQLKAKLQEEIEAMTNNIGNIEKQLVEVRRSLHAKITSLHDEKDTALLELQAFQASVKSFQSTVKKQNEEITSLQEANDELKKTICTLTKESEQAKAKLQEEAKSMANNIDSLEKQLVEVRRSLHAKIVALHQEKDAALQELQGSQVSLRNFESVVEERNRNITTLQQANDELKKTICTLTEESEQAKVKLLEEIEVMTNNIDNMEKQLVEVRRGLNAKIKALHEEKESALLQLQASQASVRNFESTIEKEKESIASLQQANVELNKTIYTLTKESEQAKTKLQEDVKSMANNIDNMEGMLVEVRRSLHAKIVALQKEKDDALLELHTSQITIRNFESMVEKKNENITFVQQANDELKKTICTMAEESVQAKAQLQEEVKSMTNNINSLDRQLVEVRRSLHAKIAALQVEKDAALLELQESQSSVKNLEGLVDKKNENISSLQQANDELNKTIHTLNEKSEQSKAKLQEEIEAMTNNIGNIEKQLVEVRRSLHAKITSLHDEKDTALLELQASQASLKSFESTVEKQNEEITSLQEVNDELKKTICTLTEESEQAKAKLQEEAKSMANNIDSLEKQLVEVRRSLHAKIVALHQEKDAALQELHTSQITIRNFESMVEKQNENITSVQQANDELKKTICTMAEESEQAKAQLQKEVKSMTNNINSLDKQLVEVRRSLHAKIAALQVEKDAALLELQESQSSVRDIQRMAKLQNENIVSLHKTNDELKRTIFTLTEESKQAKTKLHDEIKAAKEENDAIRMRLKQSDISIVNLENEVARLAKELSVQIGDNSTLKKQLEDATLKVSGLSEKLDNSQAEVASYISDMSLKTKELENRIKVLSSQKAKMEEDLKIMVEACSVNMTLMEEFEDMVKQRITYEVTRLGPLYQNLHEVLSSCQKLQYKYEEMSVRASQLEELKENQMEQVYKISQLKEQKLDTFMENTKLHKQVQDLEIQLQHLKQNLMESKWKEDRFAVTLETSQADIQNLEQLLNLLEKTLEEVKEHSESGVLSLNEQLDKLETSFSQGFPRFVYRSSASSEELKVMRKKLHDHLDEQKELLKKKDELAIRLRNKDKVLSELMKNNIEPRNLEKKMEEKESRGERTNNMTIVSKRWPILRRRKWRRNSYSC